MFSVALVGPDGSGKTVIARRLEKCLADRVKYLYMGINAESSNVALPTTRIAERLKNALSERDSDGASPQTSRARKPRGPLWSTLRLFNRLAEEIYRYALSWIYRKWGRIVVYDRYYKFDFACDSGDLSAMPLSERLHRMWLARLYPCPDLTIFLDAPPEVLFARKKEGTLEWLAERQGAILREGKALRNFIRVDAARPLDDVYGEVEHHVMSFQANLAHPTQSGADHAA